MAGDGAADDRVSAEIEVRIGSPSYRVNNIEQYNTTRIIRVSDECKWHLCVGEYLSTTTIDFGDKVHYQHTVC